ncbi:Cytochrome c oxidase subunit 6B [Xylographa pallens]|nr:Cytochrome c oxidase subunit 6B [Xylographa pallens]
MSDDEERETKPFNWYVIAPVERSTEGSILDVSVLWCYGDNNLRPVTTLMWLILFLSSGFDARFPNQNQTKHCWQNYVDYHKCILAKGEDFAPCRQFFLAYRSLCPSAWCERWDDQREKGTFPTRLDA